MKALVVDGPQQRPDVREVETPTPPAHGVLIRVVATGVCRSDWHAWVGHDASVRFPHVPGHEFSGIVEAVGAEVQSIRSGMRVTAPFCCACGTCGECQRGHQNICEREFQPGFDAWGSFAEFVVVPWADVNVVAVPDSIEMIEAAALGCRFITAFHGLVNRARVQPGETVVVFGCGGVGLSSIAVANAVGARVIAIDISDDRLALARETGASHTIRNTSDAETVEAILGTVTGGVDVTVDAFGSAATLAQGVRTLRRRGRHLQLGLLLGADLDPRVPMQDVIRRELVVLGSHGMAARHYRQMYSMIENAGIDLRRFVGSVIPLDRAGEALTTMDQFTGTGMTVVEVAS